MTNLKSDLFFRLSANPSLLREELTASDEKKLVIIDEIQKLPILLNEVHFLIENHDMRFILTGSSPRKLKSGAANLLGGRALTRHLFPLTSNELPEYNLERIINFGSLPAFYTSPDPYEDLESYVGTYLQEDTLIGSVLQPFTGTVKRKAISTAKFYFFDIGVSNILAQRFQIKQKTELFGKAFEHFIFLELSAYLHYSRTRDKLSFWRSKAGYEVDFLIGDKIGIEVKGTDTVSAKHLRGLKALSEDITLKRKIVISLDPATRQMGDIIIYPYKIFLEKLWQNEITS